MMISEVEDKLTLYSVSFVISIRLMVYIIFNIPTNSSLVVVVVVEGVSQTIRIDHARARKMTPTMSIEGAAKIDLD